jgi:hypothetical protein
MGSIHINPYESPVASRVVLQNPALLTAQRREWNTAVALICAIICIVSVYGIGIAQLPAPMWDRLGPQIYHAVTLTNRGVLIVGLISCCIAVILANWKHRFLAIWIAVAYASLLPGLYQWITS